MLFAAMLLFFIILNGRITWEVLLVGIVLCAAADLLACRTLGWSREKSRKAFRLLPKILSYACLMVWEILKANAAVIRVILDPKMRGMEPRMVRLPSGLKTEIGVTALSDSITITPGTFTASTQGEDLLVHCLGEEFRVDRGELSFHKALLEMQKKEEELK